MLACRRGHLETAKVLLEHGANVDKAKEVRQHVADIATIYLMLLQLQDSVGPLHIASYEGYHEVVKYLTHRKVYTDATDHVRPFLLGSIQHCVLIITYAM
jgi:ankyrin repeat protein